MSRRMGADVVLDPDARSTSSPRSSALTGGGADVAIEALGTQETFENALRCLRPGGTLSSLGVYSGKLQMPYDAFAAGIGDHRIVTTLCPGGKERMRRLLEPRRERPLRSEAAASRTRCRSSASKRPTRSSASGATACSRSRSVPDGTVALYSPSCAHCDSSIRRPSTPRRSCPSSCPIRRRARAEIRVRVHVCGICRTDLHVIEGDLPPVRMPIIPGHQVVGVVDALGPECRRFAVGDRVGIAWLRQTDGTCDFCRRGEENLCAASRYTGWHDDGGYAELAVVREDFAYAIPAAFSDDEAAPLLCAGIIGYRALARSACPRRRAARALRLRLVGARHHAGGAAPRLRALRLHARRRAPAPRARARRRLGRRQPTRCRRCRSTAPSSSRPPARSCPWRLRALRKGGTVALAGIHMSAIPSMTYDEHLFHEKTLTSVEANTRADGEALLAIAAAIPIRPRRRLFHLADANRALATLAHDGIDGTGILVVRR